MLLGKRYNSVYTFYPTKKFPLLGERIWDTYQQLMDYINDPDSLAIEGISMSVIADDDASKNGMYYISKVAREEGETGVAEKLGAGGSGGGGGIDSIEFNLASSATYAVSLTINKVTKNITAATLKSSLGLGSLAYKSSLVASDIPSLPWSKITSGKPTTLAGYGVTDVVANSVETKVFRGETPSGGIYPRFRLFAEGNYTYLQAASADGASTQGAVVIGPMYGSKSLTEIKLMADKVGIMKTPSVALDVNGELNSTNFMQGSVISSDPTSSFQTSIFGAADSAYCKMRLVRKPTDTDGINKAYAPILAMKTYDTHAFLAISYNTANKCYIGGGIGDAINWSAIIFHNNMDLIPKWNNNSSLGSSSNRWKEVHAVSIKIGDATITWDASAGMLKADKGIYSSGDLVAGK